MADLTVSNDIDNFMQSADSAAARTNLGLGNVNNTSDADKPVSSAQQDALNNKQDILTEGAFENGDKTKLDNQSGVNTGDESTATETTEGVVELATEAEVLAASAVDAVVRAKHMRVKVETGIGNAVSIGDLGGNARGSGSLTIQVSRSSATQVASGISGVAIGNNSTASKDRATAVGYYATASGYYATAVGYYATATIINAIAVGNYATATSDRATAVGYSATASGYLATAVGGFATASGFLATASGYLATASQENSGAFGHRAKSATANAQELGYWSPSTRGGAVRVHGTGYVTISTPQTDTAFTDGGATAGSEADGTIFRKGLAFRVSVAGNLIATYCDSAGVITSLDLGAMA